MSNGKQSQEAGALVQLENWKNQKFKHKRGGNSGWQWQLFKAGVLKFAGRLSKNRCEQICLPEMEDKAGQRRRVLQFVDESLKEGWIRHQRGEDLCAFLREITARQF